MQSFASTQPSTPTSAKPLQKKSPLVTSQPTNLIVKAGEQYVPDDYPSGQILCCYQNSSPKMQIIRSTDDHPESHWHLERVVFPGQRLLFQAPQQARLQVYTGSPAAALVADTIPCNRLQVQEK